jgi:hypothetical protein
MSGPTVPLLHSANGNRLSSNGISGSRWSCISHAGRLRRQFSQHQVIEREALRRDAATFSLRCEDIRYGQDVASVLLETVFKFGTPAIDAVIVLRP